MLTEPTARILGPEDIAALEAFLLEHVDYTMFQRGNLRAAGIVYTGQPLSGVYAAAFVDGVITAVAVHAWNGNLLLAGDAGLEQALDAALAAESPPRDVRGLLGPWPAITRTRTHLGLLEKPTDLDSCEELLTLPLSNLEVPPPCPGVTLRVAKVEDTDALIRLGIAFEEEALHRTPPTDEVRATAKRYIAQRGTYVAEYGGEIIAKTNFSARLPDAVGIGGVYTAPAHRGRGHGRAVVAASLTAVAKEGVTRAVLFTQKTNIAALKAYRSIGFESVGDFGLVLFT